MPRLPPEGKIECHHLAGQEAGQRPLHSHHSRRDPSHQKEGERWNGDNTALPNCHHNLQQIYGWCGQGRSTSPLLPSAPEVYKYIFFMLDTAITNTHILYSNFASPAENMKQKEFRLVLAQALIGDYCGRLRVGRPRSLATPHPQSAY